ncbi:caspase family protein [Azospirillum brasilense]|uniref:caspase family protein n=1 Tax=Azospirillum brasilense TaxID=192 RepID=UPI000E68480D|nr:caspase family protein [Azospirillum brasilense]NUB25278.1 hypothetical protein [Azospirillum brasilense]NUB30651.1 hypothetical protein [Azospirillum brasilense]RIW08264.1 hypothetical protein D2T81_00685 [Azospirillum brasilense]
MRSIVSSVMVGLAIIGASLPSVAQTLHAVIAADTDDPKIGGGAKENAKKMEQLIDSAAKLVRLKPNTIRLQNEKFNCEGINEALGDLQIGADDVVMFYYSGHGYRLFNDQSRFPRLACSRNPVGNPQLEDAAMTLRTRKARLVIAIADSCNSFLGQVPAMMSGPEGEAALRRLFDGYQGTLILAGADYGQFSWYTQSGGVFSAQLFDALTNELEKQDSARWERVITAATRASETNYNGRIYIQQPIVLSTLQLREPPKRP